MAHPSPGVRGFTRLAAGPHETPMSRREQTPDPGPIPTAPEGTLTGLMREVFAGDDPRRSTWDGVLCGRRPHRPVRARPRDREGRLRGGLGGARHRAQAQGGVQGHPRLQPLDRRRARARRGGDRGPPLPPQHRHPLRRGAERARPLPGDGAPARRAALPAAGARPAAPREALRVAAEIARGLAHAHARGVVHRDLTPGNVFLCEDGAVKILDLGIAQILGRDAPRGGTPGYMSPERLRGQRGGRRAPTSIHWG